MLGIYAGRDQRVVLKVVRLSTDTISRIEALVGNRRLALFIREAVENELQRRENPEPPKG